MGCLTKSKNKLVSVLRLTTDTIRSKIKDDLMTFNRESRCNTVAYGIPDKKKEAIQFWMDSIWRWFELKSGRLIGGSGKSLRFELDEG